MENNRNPFSNGNLFVKELDGEDAFGSVVRDHLNKEVPAPAQEKKSKKGKK